VGVSDSGLFVLAAEDEADARRHRVGWTAAGLAVVLVPLVFALVVLGGGGRDVPAAVSPSLQVVVAPPPVAPVVPSVAPSQPASWFDRTRAAIVSPEATRAFVPIYHEAARRFHVNWLLLASIHRQETAFSSSPGTYRGLNFAHCCAGPMQFNVRNGPVSTWRLFASAYRYGIRPPSYPHRTNFHPSVYDDFDSIMAAAWLLRASGATSALDNRAWLAAYDYYGHDAFGTTYADQVLGRAMSWHHAGFEPDAEPPAAIVGRLDALYGIPARAALPKPEPNAKAKKKHRAAKKPKAGANAPAEARAARH
jgi:hypothetical protein